MVKDREAGTLLGAFCGASMDFVLDCTGLLQSVPTVAVLLLFLEQSACTVDYFLLPCLLPLVWVTFLCGFSFFSPRDPEEGFFSCQTKCKARTELSTSFTCAFKPLEGLGPCLAPGCSIRYPILAGWPCQWGAGNSLPLAASRSKRS